MGSSASKAARTAGTAARKYPTRSPPTSSTPNTAPRPAPVSPGPTVHPETQASTSRDTNVSFDSSDPDIGLNARLSELGPVQPNPTQSNSSTFNTVSQAMTGFQPSASTPSQSIFPSAASNPAVTLLAARARLSEQADAEFANVGRRGAKDRTFLDVHTIRQVLMLRDERGMGAEAIERQLNLGAGVVKTLGPRGVLGAAGF
ncbi:hypothetical protein PVAG01_02332 [Phlyctema vagabunda]|uniref:Helix-turn-helix domain-containing protein n=1 Tax=Phlyctema vagabunda TaxID=108571 RepID=A0ABR4PRM5_9HELO